jgi:hypothetical protein
MAEGTFRVSRDPQNSRDIFFEIASSDVKFIPDDQSQLKDEIDKTLTTLRIIFPQGDARFEEYFQSVLSLGQAGLVGIAAQPVVASHQLSSLKNEITAREGGKIKNQYMKALGIRAAAIGGLTLMAALVLRHYNPDLVMHSNFLFLWSGCMAGVWLSFGARKTFFRFEDLQIPEEDRLEPFVRLFFAGLLTLTIGLLFSIKAVEVHVGPVSSEQINDTVRVALLLGLLCGFSEQTLSLKVSQEASRFLDFGKKK